MGRRVERGRGVMDGAVACGALGRAADAASGGVEIVTSRARKRGRVIRVRPKTDSLAAAARRDRLKVCFASRTLLERITIASIRSSVVIPIGLLCPSSNAAFKKQKKRRRSSLVRPFVRSRLSRLLFVPPPRRSPPPLTKPCARTRPRRCTGSSPTSPSRACSGTRSCAASLGSRPRAAAAGWTRRTPPGPASPRST